VDMPTGAGGGTTGSATVLPQTSHSSVVVTSTTTWSTTDTGGDPCATGTDCSQCPDFQTCGQGYAGVHPEGYQPHNELRQCVYCTACYVTCQGAANGCGGMPMPDPCDVGMGPDACYDGNTNSGCIICAEAGSCKGATDACSQSMDCIAFNDDLQLCPQN